MRKYLILSLICLIIFVNKGICQTKYPDYSKLYLGVDKFENFNRKIFLFNGALNKYAIRPVTVIWSSVMPKYGMDRIKGVYQNVLYPRRLISSLAQGDIKAAGKTSARFLINSTLGLGGMFDPAKKFFNLKPINEDMEQMLAKWKIKQGPYLVVPILSSATPRALLGRALDSALDPTSYIGTPVLAAVKAGFTINNFTLLQPLSKTIETTYLDAYDVMKKLYALQTHIMNSNFDRDEILNAKKIEDEKELIENFAYNDITLDDIFDEDFNFKEVSLDSSMVPIDDTIKGGTSTDEVVENELKADIILKNFNPQHPVIDSMRTVLFELAGIDDSMWGEFSIWNRCFKNRIKTSAIEVTKDREKYKFRYIMQKDKNSPLAIIFPSVGEGINSHHSVVLAKLFYDEGYSVLIQGSAFHYDFVKSMPKSYRPGIPSEDVHYIKKTTSKIISYLEDKYDCKFKDKVVLGTSFGAMSSLFLADCENKNNTMNISKFISINPPIELIYAMRKIDSNSEEWDKNPNNLKEKTSYTAAKILKSVEQKEDGVKFEQLPFNLEEAKLITGFVLHQKLSDMIFSIEEAPIAKKSDIYEKINNTSYEDYAKKYLVSKQYPDIESFSSCASLHSIKDYLKTANNYRIYHTLDDYLVNTQQLKKLKDYSKDKLTLIDKGAHLGFLYRDEFINDLKKEISLKEKPRL